MSFMKLLLEECSLKITPGITANIFRVKGKYTVFSLR